MIAFFVVFAYSQDFGRSQDVSCILDTKRCFNFVLRMSRPTPKFNDEPCGQQAIHKEKESNDDFLRTMSVFWVTYFAIPTVENGSQK